MDDGEPRLVAEPSFPLVLRPNVSTPNPSSIRSRIGLSANESDAPRRIEEGARTYSASSPFAFSTTASAVMPNSFITRSPGPERPKRSMPTWASL